MSDLSPSCKEVRIYWGILREIEGVLKIMETVGNVMNVGTKRTGLYGIGHRMEAGMEVGIKANEKRGYPS